MDEFSVLSDLGLTKGEIKVYLALLELGSSTTGRIIKKAKVSRSKVYEMLDRLLERGFVSFVIKENFKYFNAAKPTAFITYIKAKKMELDIKEQMLERILPTLQAKQESKKENQSATMYEGINGIKTMYNEILSALCKGEEYYVIAVEPEIYDYENFGSFIINHHRRRAERGIKVKLLANACLRHKIANSIGRTRHTKIRYYSQYIPTATLIYRNNMASFVWSKNPMGFVIQSSTIAKRYRHFFDDVWNIAKS